jgi:1D-myo-inositol 3-kinase
MRTAPVSPHSPDILLIGTVSRDLPGPGDFSSYVLGGTVTFAAAVAAHLGRRPTVLTYAAPDTDFSVMPPATELIVLPSAATTAFANVYTPHGRVQYCYSHRPRRSPPADIPAAMRNPSAVLLGPLVGEVTPDVAAIFGPGTLVAAVPQGWMRRWDDGGAGPQQRMGQRSRRSCPHLDVLVLSLEDIDYDWNRLAARL